MREGNENPIEERKKMCYHVPIGPQHPMYVEAENLMVHLDGERIVDVDVNIGYMHRGIEELMQKRNYIQALFLAERICGICSGVHSITYTQCVENLAGVEEIPERAKLIRTIVLELERLHSHLLFFGVAGYEIGLDTLFMYTWRDREHVLDMLEMISGNRVNYAIPTPGGVRRNIPEGKIPEMLKKLDYMEKQCEYYSKVFRQDRLFRERSEGLGILKKGDVQRLHILGPVARASGIRDDVRKNFPYLSYGELDWSMVTQTGNDVKARVMVKALEMFQSIKMIRQCLNRIVRTPKELKIRVPLVIPAGEAIAFGEAPRGELIYHGRSNGTDMPERMRIRTPSFVNIPYCVPLMLREQQLADLPLIVASIDPCFSCCDRVTLLDTKTGEKKRVDENYMRRLRE